MITPIRKAIFPVAGLGTRFLPATKANPKEMLPIVDKPLIQYAVEEAIQAGIQELIFITSSSKRAIEDHFDSNYELEAKLAQQGKNDLLAIVRAVVPKGVSCAYIRQPEALGLGHAVLCAQPLLGNAPFAVILADDLIEATPGCLAQMLACYATCQHSVVAVQKIPWEETSRHGIAAVTSTAQIIHLIEKPQPNGAPSNLGVVGRYLLTPAIFECLQKTTVGQGGELQLTDGIARLLKQEAVTAFAFEGKRYDCGSKLGYLEATVEFALKHPDLAENFCQYLKTLVKQL